MAHPFLAVQPSNKQRGFSFKGRPSPSVDPRIELRKVSVWGGGEGRNIGREGSPFLARAGRFVVEKLEIHPDIEIFSWVWVLGL